MWAALNRTNPAAEMALPGSAQGYSSRQKFIFVDRIFTAASAHMVFHQKSDTGIHREAKAFKGA